MRQCKNANCSNTIPWKKVIDDKIRFLTARKYCLVCSPFGMHNTRQIENSVKFGEITICRYCNRKYNYNRKKGHSLDICGSCRTNRRRYKIKETLVSMLGGKCSRCGYNKCIQALQFHHRDPKTKKFPISGSHSRSFNVIKEEAKKCDLLCSNCHVEVDVGKIK